MIHKISINREQYHGFWGKIGLELSTNNTTVTMWTRDLSPYATVVRVILLNLGLVNVSQAFTKVPRYFLLSVNSLNLYQRCVWVLIRLRPITTITQNIYFFYPYALTKQKKISFSFTFCNPVQFHEHRVCTQMIE